MNTVDTAKSAHHSQNSTFSLSGKTLGICIGLIVIAVVALTIFKVSLGTLLFAGALLMCPLLHMWMMKGNGHKH